MASESSIRIPPEIITEILYRLPAKSVGRFKCVSKEWLSLFSEPKFIKTHQKTLNRTHLIFNYSDDDSLCSVPFHHHEAEATPTKLELKSHYAGFAFYGSCNGLVLLSTSLCDHDLPTLVILNPTTTKFLELPKSGYNMVDKVFISSFLGIRTAFFQYGIMFGFGYDSLNDDYKVVTVSFLHRHYQFGSNKISVHIYSLRTNTWRWVINSLYDHSYVNTSGVFVNGALYWLARNYSDCSPIVVAFSLTNEKFSEVPSPDLSSYGDIVAKNECKLVVLGEKLAIFLEREGVVWLMND